MKRTPLYDIHKKLNARMVNFAGWEMPVQYSQGVLTEHKTVRQGVGLFDISHMGEIFVEGPKARDFINYITTNNIKKIHDGKSQYSVCCYEHGGVVDDVISYQFNPNKYLVIVNASNTAKDYDWFVKNNRHGVRITNRSDEFFLLALQGPRALNIMASVNQAVMALKPFHFMEGKIADIPVLLSHTGYTGEDGCEIMGPWARAPQVWNILMEAGAQYNIQPIGLAARDSLRLEAGYSLYGHEINDAISPLEARLAWVVSLDKKGFIGQKTLLSQSQEGVKRQLIGVIMAEAGIPRDHCEVYKDDREIGWVTSGTFSPILEKGIGLALVDKVALPAGAELFVDIRGKKKRACVIKLPMYKKEGV